ncbi:hypothetical protein HK098_004323 [Nowakowskiella sp. JEL0407]|nr:hypothetical protein HK098_004323 [Nowakowskiella sp. JEL0407]
MYISNAEESSPNHNVSDEIHSALRESLTEQAENDTSAIEEQQNLESNLELSRSSTPSSSTKKTPTYLNDSHQRQIVEHTLAESFNINNQLQLSQEPWPAIPDIDPVELTGSNVDGEIFDVSKYMEKNLFPVLLPAIEKLLRTVNGMDEETLAQIDPLTWLAQVPSIFIMVMSDAFVVNIISFMNSFCIDSIQKEKLKFRKIKKMRKKKRIHYFKRKQTSIVFKMNSTNKK